MFMNNDVFVTEPGWLGRMIGELADRAGGDAVGAKLLYPDRPRAARRRGGAGIHGVAAHVHAGIRWRGLRLSSAAHCLSQEFTAVHRGAAAGATARVFDEVGGFDEVRHSSVAYNDVDLCLKIP